VQSGFSVRDPEYQVLSKFHVPPTAEDVRLAKLALKSVAKSGLLPKVFSAYPELWRMYPQLVAVVRCLLCRGDQSGLCRLL